MGWFKDAVGAVTNPVGTIGNALGVDSKYTSMLDPMGAIRGSIFKSATDKKTDPNAGLDLYNNSLTSGAKASADAKKQQYFGSTLGNLGSETEDYVGRLQGNLDKNVAKADLYNQQAGQQRALDNARAGLSGVDTSAMNEQGRRNAQFGAASINESAKRDALGLYGQSISNRIEGANQIDANEMQLAIAQMKQPQAQNNPGLLGSIFGGFGL